MRISQKNKYYVLVITIIMMVVVGCQSTQKPAVSEKKPVAVIAKQLTFQHYFSGSLSGGINQMVQKMNEQSDQYRITAVPLDHEAFKVRITEAINSIDAADLYSYWAGAKTQSLSESLEPLNDVWDAQKLDDKFPQSIMESAVTYDGNKLLLPITQHYVGIVINQKIFDENGLTVPKDWAAYLKTCETLKSKGITPIALGSKSKWPAQFWFDYILLRTSGYDYRQALMAGKASYTDKEVIKSFELWKVLMDRGYINKDANALEWDTGAAEMVYSGKAAMTLMGTWVIGYYEDSAHQWKLGKDYNIIDFPTMDSSVPCCALGPIDGIVIPKDSINKEQAKSLIVNFASVENQKAMSLDSGAFAPSLEVEDAFYSPERAALLNRIRQMEHWAFNYDLATPPERAEIGLDAFQDFIQYPKEYKSILKGVQSKMEKMSH